MAFFGENGRALVAAHCNAHDKRFILRTPVTEIAGKPFKAVGVALPPNIREAHAPTPA